MNHKLKKYSLILCLAACCLGSAVFAQLNVNQASGSKSINTEIAVYPNPALDYFTLTSDGDAVKKITINNIIGKQVLSFQRNEMNKYDVSPLKKGIYVVRVFDHNDQLIKALRLSKS